MNGERRLEGFSIISGTTNRTISGGSALSELRHRQSFYDNAGKGGGALPNRREESL